MLAHEHVSDCNENRELVQLRGMSLDRFVIYDSQDQDIHRLEYINGKVYAMAGGLDEHAALSGELFGLMRNHLGKKGACRAFGSDKRTVKEPGRASLEGDSAKGVSVYPDASVHCRDDNGDYQPLVLVEVLSVSTQDKDRTEKLVVYRKLSSVRDILFIEQGKRFVELYSRMGDIFAYSSYGAGESLTLQSIGLDVSIDDLYEGVLPEG